MENLIFSSEAFQHGKDAYGARFLKAGFAFTSQQDLAFALGYPHIVFLADDLADDMNDPVKAAKKFADTHALCGGIWPKDIACRTIRSWDLFTDSNAFTDDTPILPKEVSAIIEREFETNRVWILAYLLEAFVGPDVVCEAVMEKLEKLPQEEWSDNPPTVSYMDTFIYFFGFLLLRLAPVDFEKARKRLEALYQKLIKVQWKTVSASLRALDVLLHGKEGAERSGYKPDGKSLSRYYIDLVSDDPQWIEKCLRESGKPDSSLLPNPRLVFLGGNEVLKMEIGWWKKYTYQHSHAVMVAGFGMIKSPLILDLMLQMTALSKAKKDAVVWFVEHKVYAHDFLEKTVQDKGDESTWAQKILDFKGYKAAVS